MDQRASAVGESIQTGSRRVCHSVHNHAHLILFIGNPHARQSWWMAAKHRGGWISGASRRPCTHIMLVLLNTITGLTCRMASRHCSFIRAKTIKKIYSSCFTIRAGVLHLLLADAYCSGAISELVVGLNEKKAEPRAGVYRCPACGGYTGDSPLTLCRNDER